MCLTSYGKIKEFSVSQHESCRQCTIENEAGLLIYAGQESKRPNWTVNGSAVLRSDPRSDSS